MAAVAPRRGGGYQPPAAGVKRRLDPMAPRHCDGAATPARRDHFNQHGSRVITWHGRVHGLATALLGAGLGVQLFLSYLVAPATFRLVDRSVAVRLMEGLFPGYYAFGLVVIAIALVLALALAVASRARSAGARPRCSG